MDSRNGYADLESTLYEAVRSARYRTDSGASEPAHWSTYGTTSTFGDATSSDYHIRRVAATTRPESPLSVLTAGSGPLRVCQTCRHHWAGELTGAKPQDPALLAELDALRKRTQLLMQQLSQQQQDQQESVERLKSEFQAQLQGMHVTLDLAHAELEAERAARRAEQSQAAVLHQRAERWQSDNLLLNAQNEELNGRIRSLTAELERYRQQTLQFDSVRASLLQQERQVRDLERTNAQELDALQDRVQLQAVAHERTRAAWATTRFQLHQRRWLAAAFSAWKCRTVRRHAACAQLHQLLVRFHTKRVAAALRTWHVHAQAQSFETMRDKWRQRALTQLQDRQRQRHAHRAFFEWRRNVKLMAAVNKMHATSTAAALRHVFRQWAFNASESRRQILAAKLQHQQRARAVVQLTSILQRHVVKQQATAFAAWCHLLDTFRVVETCTNAMTRAKRHHSVTLLSRLAERWAVVTRLRALRTWQRNVTQLTLRGACAELDSHARTVQHHSAARLLLHSLVQIRRRLLVRAMQTWHQRTLHTSHAAEVLHERQENALLRLNAMTTRHRQQTLATTFLQWQRFANEVGVQSLVAANKQHALVILNRMAVHAQERARKAHWDAWKSLAAAQAGRRAAIKRLAGRTRDRVLRATLQTWHRQAIHARAHDASDGWLQLQGARCEAASRVISRLAGQDATMLARTVLRAWHNVASHDRANRRLRAQSLVTALHQVACQATQSQQRAAFMAWRRCVLQRRVLLRLARGTARGAMNHAFSTWKLQSARYFQARAELLVTKYRQSCDSTLLARCMWQWRMATREALVSRRALAQLSLIRAVALRNIIHHTSARVQKAAFAHFRAVTTLARRRHAALATILRRSSRMEVKAAVSSWASRGQLSHASTEAYMTMSVFEQWRCVTLTSSSSVVGIRRLDSTLCRRHDRRLVARVFKAWRAHNNAVSTSLHQLERLAASVHQRSLRRVFARMVHFHEMSELAHSIRCRAVETYNANRNRRYLRQVLHSWMTWTKATRARRHVALSMIRNEERRQVALWFRVFIAGARISRLEQQLSDAAHVATVEVDEDHRLEQMESYLAGQQSELLRLRSGVSSSTHSRISRVQL